MKGILYIISTPIGNLKDITLRALEVLKTVDYILCEDTRVTGKLLHHYEISKKLVSFNDFSEEAKTPVVIKGLLSGQVVALVSDAGTPLISDPGYKLVRECIHQGIAIESIPGPSSVITALTVSGLPPDKFTFVSYLPKKDVKRKSFLEDLKKGREIVKSTIIIFESPYRLIKSLEDIKQIFGDIEIVVCRELTKMHEEIKSAKVSQVIEYFLQSALKGEFIILF
ncbi:16S rRNA (cytidine(1402)-2'-O)-methyltransferase [Candidatus Curtissbacteria bacterium RIFCSPLOWO2_01_FULL_38_11b]|uniref:Ribosomal RNA small subunit methyltransferase I n=1 Tax=Candidatus Curtissbacteria bacterium RIFCSPLOWO2_01_FULL_38_11b TaxID=1797725 RepID=A0A1F5GZP3_9BACT|nr:MAG: 16S rRNA (cytidine(1402)-2'-O)-methyltransferase [Candidatus Curtissbacteria bacterium RIFCSPLOWO2_01_FULL_38_11b]